MSRNKPFSSGFLLIPDSQPPLLSSFPSDGNPSTSRQKTPITVLRHASSPASLLRRDNHPRPPRPFPVDPLPMPPLSPSGQLQVLRFHSHLETPPGYIRGPPPIRMVRHGSSISPSPRAVPAKLEEV